MYSDEYFNEIVDNIGIFLDDDLIDDLYDIFVVMNDNPYVAIRFNTDNDNKKLVKYPLKDDGYLYKSFLMFLSSNPNFIDEYAIRFEMYYDDRDDISDNGLDEILYNIRCPESI